MRKLFEVGLNDAGFYVYPYTNRPRHQEVHGDEVTPGQATDLRDSLNHSVKTYIAQIARDDPNKLLQAIAKHWRWTGILSLITDLIWREAWDNRQKTNSQAQRDNSQALGRVVRDWR